MSKFEKRFTGKDNAGLRAKIRETVARHETPAGRAHAVLTLARTVALDVAGQYTLQLVAADYASVGDVSAYDKFVAHFPGNAFAAYEFEQAVLAIGHDFLPACAVAVLDGAEGTPEYWTWLTEQAEEAERETAAEREDELT